MGIFITVRRHLHNCGRIAVCVDLGKIEIAYLSCESAVGNNLHVIVFRAWAQVHLTQGLRPATKHRVQMLATTLGNNVSGATSPFNHGYRLIFLSGA